MSSTVAYKYKKRLSSNLPSCPTALSLGYLTFNLLPKSAVRRLPCISSHITALLRHQVELDEFHWGDRYNGPKSGMQTPHADPISPVGAKTPNELEMSRPPSPKHDEAASLVQTWSNPPMNRFRVLSCCLTYFGNGMNDSGMCLWLILAITFITYRSTFTNLEISL